MSINSLETPNASAQYDEENNIVWVTYRGILNADATVDVYTWLSQFFETHAADEIYGEVFDFRQVQTFGPDNLFEARKKSRGFNLRQNVSDLPVAMIVSNFYQEEILRGPMQNVPENNRKRIVKSEADALDFIHSWHLEQTPE